ncbi:MAG: hypothetical protein AMK73_07485 [Planctomycetes bacterium SM23_32]|nr:MAG: hypothetical protein AMK73_07485 [Planctomycetes bacterium SM23_32]
MQREKASLRMLGRLSQTIGAALVASGFYVASLHWYSLAGLGEASAGHILLPATDLEVARLLQGMGAGVLLAAVAGALRHALAKVMSSAA